MRGYSTWCCHVFGVDTTTVCQGFELTGMPLQAQIWCVKVEGYCISCWLFVSYTGPVSTTKLQPCTKACVGSSCPALHDACPTVVPLLLKYRAWLFSIRRYCGQGRVAAPGFKNSRWVDGELLQFSATASPLLTGGAQLGFVWAVPGEKRFLILLNRIDLN